MSEPSILIVVAAAENGVIGRDGAMPWRLSTDLKRFKSITMDCPLIMGRKTFDSIGGALPGRLNIVLSHDPDWEGEGAIRVGSLEAALDLATVHIESAHKQAIDDGEEPDELDICVIGGETIFRQALPSADEIHLTVIKAEIDGDTYFPPIDASRFHRIHSEDIEAGPRDSHATRYEVWRRT